MIVEDLSLVRKFLSLSCRYFRRLAASHLSVSEDWICCAVKSQSERIKGNPRLWKVVFGKNQGIRPRSSFVRQRWLLVSRIEAPPQNKEVAIIIKTLTSMFIHCSSPSDFSSVSMIVTHTNEVIQSNVLQKDGHHIKMHTCILEIQRLPSKWDYSCETAQIFVPSNCACV